MKDQKRLPVGSISLERKYVISWERSAQSHSIWAIKLLNSTSVSLFAKLR